MKKILFNILVFSMPIFGVLFVVQPINAATSAGDIIINEIMQNPSAVGDADGEWFEVYNTTNSPIDLDGCTISDDGSNSHDISGTLLVAPHSYAVLAKNATSTENGGLNVDYDYSGFILGNTSDEIILTCNSVEIDRVEYDNGATFPDPTGASMSLGNPLSNNSDGNNWCTSDSTYGDGDLGTPGALNDSCGGFMSGDIKVCKYEDLDGNLITSVDQSAIENFTFILDYGIATTSQATGLDGCATFGSLDAGEYNISEVLNDGWVILSPTGGEATTTVNYGATSSLNFYNLEYGSISGYKYKDGDGLASTTNDLTALFDWKINLFNSVSTTTPIATTTTDSNGYYEFNNLLPESFNLSENLLDGWAQVTASTSTIVVLSGVNSENNNFTNYLIPFCGDDNIDVLEQCDDGNSQNGDGCSATCNIESSGSVLIYSNQGVNQQELTKTTKIDNTVDNFVIITWRTSQSATSRVIYDTVSHLNIDEEQAPNYGYKYSTEKSLNKVTGHSVKITGLNANATYYFRSLSSASPEKYSDEMSFSTAVSVLDEEGAPVLEIAKKSNKDFANPGSEIEYTVTVTNSGNLISYDTVLTDTLPNEFVYSEDGTNKKQLVLGDIVPGENKTISYKVLISEEAANGIYANLVEVVSSNHEAVREITNVEVNEVEVLGIELAETGLNPKEFIFLISLITCLASSSLFLKRRYYI